MIIIEMSFQGLHTHASASIGEGLGHKQLHCRESSGAKALTRMVDLLRMAKMAGEEWETAGVHPQMRGVVPGTGFRKPPAKRKAKQTAFV